jgi:diketogulonate reductase-like aldo/keto reductase
MNRELPRPPAMPLVGLGTYMLKGAACSDVVHKALKMGYRHIDTAEMYQNEAEIGEGIARSGVARSDLFVTTKVWPNNFASADFTRAANQSLRRLRTDYIDLLLLHWPQADVPVEQPLEALAKLIDSGKVRYGGVSNFSAEQMHEARRIAPMTVSNIQIKCNADVVPGALIKTARENNLNVTAYSPLGQGAARRDQRLKDIAERLGCTPSQVALRWMTQQGVAVIPKTSNVQRLEENLLSTNFHLPDTDIDYLGKF